MLDSPDAHQELNGLIADLRAQRNYAQADMVHGLVGVICLKSALNMRLMDLLQQRMALVHDAEGPAPSQFDLLADYASSPHPVQALAHAVEKFAALRELWCYFTSTKGVQSWNTTSPMHVLHFLQWVARWLDAQRFYLNVKVTHTRATHTNLEPQSTFCVCEHTVTQFVAQAPTRYHSDTLAHSRGNRSRRVMPYKMRMRLLAQAMKV